MKPGRDLDALVATKIMGWTADEEMYSDGGGGETPYKIWRYGTDMKSVRGRSTFRPSTNIFDAMEVIEKIYGCWDLRSWADCWVVKWSIPGSEKHVRVEAPTAPLAIALAALKAVEDK